jgi:quercetin dioxygenase-like cupin family protein
MTKEGTMAAAMREEIRVGEMTIRFLLQDDALSMFEFDVPADAKVPAAHSHDAYEETLYGLAGVVTFTVDGERVDIGRGDVFTIPRGAVHRFDNLSGEPATTLAVVTPGLLGPSYFREVADVLSAGGPPDFAAVAGVMRRHGLTPAPGA